MPRRLLVLLVCAAVTGVAHTQTPQKPPWEWSDGERIAALMDDAAAARRLEASKGRWSAEEGSAKPHDRIDGSDDPHLFFSWQLFDSVVALWFAEDAHTREVWREMNEEHRQRVGLPDDVWDRLEQISATYLDSRRRHREIGLSTIPTAQRRQMLRNLWPVVCRDRYLAMREAEAEFGQAFTIFLYTAVAPRKSSVMLRKQNPQTLASISRGCS